MVSADGSSERFKLLYSEVQLMNTLKQAGHS